ncbi:MATE family efflux transporter [Bacillus sp. CGMCC 1.16541]|uniref:MATE family efflux transporter n=1 Tax=Bacillus sp. CGMCC 1.16541 TaxID=2185143 RepID=UPI000D736BD5|nr:MATE family efflux transporter [Bacillus sp. CGMCC 1.16541]
MKKKYYTALVALALPAIMEQALQSMVGFIDMIFISKLGLNEVAAVGVTNTILQIYFAVFLALGVSSTVFVARYTGAKQEEKAKMVTHQSIVLSLIIACSLGIISMWFGEHLFRLLGADEDVVSHGLIYFKIIAIPSVLISLMFTFGAIFRGYGDTKTPLKIGIQINIIHVVLDYVLIFGVFFEGFGLMGAAMATVIARFIGVSLFIKYMLKRDMLSRAKEAWRINKEEMSGLIRIGVPAGLERLFMRFGQVIYFGMIVRMGTGVYAAHTLAGNFTIFVSVIGSGFAIATTTLVGKSIGAGDLSAARVYSKCSMMLMVGIMTLVSVVVYLLSPYAASFLVHQSSVITLIVTVLAIDIIAQPATALVSSLTAVLQSGGSTKFPMYVTALGIWCIRTLGVYVLGVSLGFGLVGVWVSIALDNYVRATILMIRYRRNGWIKQLA